MALCFQVCYHRYVQSAILQNDSNNTFLSVGDAAVGKSSLLTQLTDQRFLANPDPTVRFISNLEYSCLKREIISFPFPGIWASLHIVSLAWSLDRN